MTTSLPILSDVGLQRYLQQIKTFPMLSAEEEYMLAKRWQEHGDMEAAQSLTTSHLRLVVKIAMGYRGYGLPVGDLIAEGSIGLMQAVKRFEPDRGFRLATYAMWWIKAAIQEYILRSWSLVKLGTSAAQKKLFFNLRKVKRHIGILEDGKLTPEQVTDIADRLNVSRDEVMDMDGRMSGSDQSLNQTLTFDSEDEWIDRVAEPSDNQETILAESQDFQQKKALLANAMQVLTPREQEILQARRLLEEPRTLEDLSQQYNISRERVRQIEVRAMEKLEKEMRGDARPN